MKSGILLLLMCLLMPAAVRAACVVDNRATIPLTVVDAAITIPVQVNGITATFILDTGAQRSVVTQDAVRRLNLARDQWVGTTMSGVGGVESRPNADPRSLTLGGIPLVRRTLNHDTSLTVGILPRTQAGHLVIDGLLGRDFLSLFDLDLDIPDQRLTLYQPRNCAGRFLPWTNAYATLPASFSFDSAPILTVMLDGTPLRALLDSGASATLLAAPGMFRLGLQSSSLQADPSIQLSGLGPHMVTMREHSFRSLKVGAQLTDAPTIWVGPIRLMPITDMLLGADWLARRRVWISFTTKQLFLASEQP